MCIIKNIRIFARILNNNHSYIRAMNLKRYIKVTPQDEPQAVILLATNRDFYLSQGAKVEQPTEEEVLEAFPELRPQYNAEQAQAAAQVHATEQDARIADLEQELATLQAENATLKEELAALRAAKPSTRKTTKDDE